MATSIPPGPRRGDQFENVGSLTRRQSLVASLTIIALLGGSIGWSVLAPLSSGVVAAGQIVVDTNRKKIQHLEGGIVREIRVENGDTVEAGEVLVLLDGTDALVERDVRAAEYLALRAKEARLQAELAGVDVLEFPDFLNAASQRRDQAIALMKTQILEFQSRRETRRERLKILGKQIDRSGEKILGLNRKIKTAEDQLSSIDKELQGVNRLLAKGYVPATRVYQLEREKARISGEVESDLADIAETEISIGETRIEIIQVKTEFQEEVSKQLSEIQADIYVLEPKLTGAGDVLERREIISPIDGVVLNMTIHTIGGVVAPGDTLLEVVPSRDELLVEAEISPVDIEAVTVGDAASVRFSALSAKLTPLLDGRVTHVAADATENSEKQNVYVSRVTIEKLELSKLGDVDLVPGMPVEVLIRKGERTAISYLLDPLSSIIFRGMKE